MILNTSIDNSYLYVHLSNILDPKGIVHICHGKAEHIGRYKWLISKLNDDGYHVIAIDHRGHGKKILNKDDIGKFSDHQNGWDLVVNDYEILINDTKKSFPELKQFLFAHSMGSWIALSMLKKELKIDGLILSGSSKFPKFLIAAQKFIIKIDIFFNGRGRINNVMETITTNRFNNYFKPTRTISDWISTDNNNVDDYVQDDLCGFKVTNGLWMDMAQGIEDSFKSKKYNSANKNIPVLVISGSEDPVGDFKKGVMSLYNFLGKFFNNINIKIFEEERHEVFSGTKKVEAYKLLNSFIERI